MRDLVVGHARQHLLEMALRLRDAALRELVHRQVLARGREGRVDGERLVEARVGIVDPAGAGERDAEQVQGFQVARRSCERLLKAGDRGAELLASDLGECAVVDGRSSQPAICQGWHRRAAPFGSPRGTAGCVVVANRDERSRPAGKGRPSPATRPWRAGPRGPWQASDHVRIVRIPWLLCKCPGAGGQRRSGAGGSRGAQDPRPERPRAPAPANPPVVRR